jgi:hypothetical protein
MTRRQVAWAATAVAVAGTVAFAAYPWSGSAAVATPVRVFVSGPGSVTSTPPGIDACTKVCRATLRSTRISLVAVPSPAARFVGWRGGGCRSRGNVCDLTTGGRRDIRAVFQASSPAASRSRAFPDYGTSLSWERYQRELVRLSRSADSWDYYTLAYGLNAHVAMFRATGDRRHLDEALTLVDNVIKSARPSRSMPTSQFRDGYLGWVTQRQEVRGEEVPLYESYLWRYVVQMLRVIHWSPEVFASPHYRQAYSRILRFTETNIFEKWYRRGSDFVYRDRTHMAAHWAFIALDLAELTSDRVRLANYQRVVDDFDKRLRAQLTRNPTNPGAWFWNDVWGRHSHPGQDVSHGNAVIAYLTEAYDVGDGAWGPSDMARFVELLRAVVLRRTGPAEYVDGSGAGNGWLADGFVTLGRYSASLQRRLVSSPSARTPQFLANLTLNDAYLSPGGAR